MNLLTNKTILEEKLKLKYYSYGQFLKEYTVLTDLIN